MTYEIKLSKEEQEILERMLFTELPETLDDGTKICEIDYAMDQSLTTLWNYSFHVGDDFGKRREAFLWILEKLLRQQMIKLHKDGVFLTSSIEDQLKSFRDAWPASEILDADTPLWAFYLWFYSDECPAEVAWRHADGRYVF